MFILYGNNKRSLRKNIIGLACRIYPAVAAEAVVGPRWSCNLREEGRVGPQHGLGRRVAVSAVQSHIIACHPCFRMADYSGNGEACRTLLLTIPLNDDCPSVFQAGLFLLKRCLGVRVEKFAPLQNA